MKTFISMKLIRSFALLLILGTITGCTKTDLYNSDEDARKSKLPTEDSYFGFEMSGEIALNVNYAVAGFVANVEVYSENPMESKNVKKEGVKPIYSAFIKDGKLSAKMYIPFAVSEAYLYTDRMGLPRCVKLESVIGGFTYDAAKINSGSRAARAASGVLNDQLPYQLAPSGRIDNMYSLCTWNTNGKPTTPGYLSTTTKDVNGLTARVRAFLDNNKAQNGNKNENLRRDTKDLNIVIPSGGSKLEVTFIDENGEYENTFGYYYYKSTNVPATRQAYLDMPKYVIFPSAANTSFQLKCGDTAKLLFFGENGKDTPTEDFPEGYVIGWFLLKNGAPSAAGNYTGNIARIESTYVSLPNNALFRTACFSNEAGDERQFITLYDQTSHLLVVGVEDDFGGDNDFDDVMFSVKTTPDITGPGNLPEVPGENPEVKPGTEIIEGTLAFEDNWPSKGDYDMNDVIIEYKREIVYDKDNKATQVKESFTPVQRDNAAVFNNIFAYQINNMGNVALPDGCEIENASKSIVLTQSVKNIKNQTFTITRTFDSGIDKDEVKVDFNPYILVKGIRDMDKGRAEVHLPKYEPTDLIDRSKLYTENDAYYVDKDGKYPFAINLPIINFDPATETRAIDSESEYPSFRTWVDSKGEQAKDWYLRDKGAK